MPIADLDAIPEIRSDIIARVPKTLAVSRRIVPYALEGQALLVALVDPTNREILAELRSAVKGEVRGGVALPESIDRALARYYGVEPRGSGAAVGKLVELILLQSRKDRATEVHLELRDGALRVFERIDGALRELKPPPPPHLAPAILAHVKGQDGRFEVISTLASGSGESEVLRLRPY
jgi:type IV pilus assembly protein PilB